MCSLHENIVMHNPDIYVVLGKFRSGKSTLIEKLLDKPQLGISGQSLSSITSCVSPHWSRNNKILLIDTPGYGDFDQSVDLKNLNDVNEFLVALPYISNFCIMIEMGQGIGSDTLNVIKIMWDVISKNMDTNVLIIFTGANVAKFPFQDIKDDLQRKITHYKENLTFKLTRLTYTLMAVSSVENYDVNGILSYLYQGSNGTRTNVRRRTITHASAVVAKYHTEIKTLLDEIDNFKRLYEAEAGKPFDHSYRNNKYLSCSLGSTYENEIKVRELEVKGLTAKVSKVHETRIQYLANMERCVGTVKSGRRCKNTTNCYHHLNPN